MVKRDAVFTTSFASMPCATPSGAPGYHRLRFRRARYPVGAAVPAEYAAGCRREGSPPDEQRTREVLARWFSAASGRDGQTPLRHTRWKASSFQPPVVLPDQQFGEALAFMIAFSLHARGGQRD
ncbi:hypothetical protein KCP77_23180 [Salmonella enterica subsp. enterica]|nr:hypothetical protein KCP77_23180 [Salmonella enterica subsp. enterica]